MCAKYQLRDEICPNEIDTLYVGRTITTCIIFESGGRVYAT